MRRALVGVGLAVVRALPELCGAKVGGEAELDLAHVDDVPPHAVLEAVDDQRRLTRALRELEGRLLLGLGVDLVEVRRAQRRAPAERRRVRRAEALDERLRRVVLNDGEGDPAEEEEARYEEVERDDLRARENLDRAAVERRLAELLGLLRGALALLLDGRDSRHRLRHGLRAVFVGREPGLRRLRAGAVEGHERRSACEDREVGPLVPEGYDQHELRAEGIATKRASSALLTCGGTCCPHHSTRVVATHLSRCNAFIGDGARGHVRVKSRTGGRVCKVRLGSTGAYPGGRRATSPAPRASPWRLFSGKCGGDE